MMLPFPVSASSALSRLEDWNWNEEKRKAGRSFRLFLPSFFPHSIHQQASITLQSQSRVATAGTLPSRSASARFRRLRPTAERGRSCRWPAKRFRPLEGSFTNFFQCWRRYFWAAAFAGHQAQPSCPICIVAAAGPVVTRPVVTRQPPSYSRSDGPAYWGTAVHEEGPARGFD